MTSFAPVCRARGRHDDHSDRLGRPSARAELAELDARIVAAFADDAKSVDVARLLAEVMEATSAAELAAETAREHALDPLLSGDDLKLARCAMLDAAFKRDRLQEASAKLAERVEALKALEADRRMWAEHERVLKPNGTVCRGHGALSRADCADRSPCSSDRSLRTRDRAAQCDIGGEVWPYPPRLSGAAPAITALFQDVLVWDTFITVAGQRCRQLFPAGQTRATNCASTDQRVRNRRFRRDRAQHLYLADGIGQCRHPVSGLRDAAPDRIGAAYSGNRCHRALFPQQLLFGPSGEFAQRHFERWWQLVVAIVWVAGNPHAPSVSSLGVSRQLDA